LIAFVDGMFPLCCAIAAVRPASPTLTRPRPDLCICAVFTFPPIVVLIHIASRFRFPVVFLIPSPLHTRCMIRFADHLCSSRHFSHPSLCSPHNITISTPIFASHPNNPDNQQPTSIESNQIKSIDSHRLLLLKITISNTSSVWSTPTSKGS